ncbi:transposase [Pisciglobus halotolerans]|uniref:transposase n=1 Tax=Pisciglobus halotolerans TaxID=745365 RepID=UPI0011600EEF
MIFRTFEQFVRLLFKRMRQLIINEESVNTWHIFFDCHKERDLQGTKLISSDTHKSLVSITRTSFNNEISSSIFNKNSSTISNKKIKNNKIPYKILHRIMDVTLNKCDFL